LRKTPACVIETKHTDLCGDGIAHYALFDEDLFPECCGTCAVGPGECFIGILPCLFTDDGFPARFAERLRLCDEADEVVGILHHLQAGDVRHDGAVCRHAALPEQLWQDACVVADVVWAKTGPAVFNRQDCVGRRTWNAVVHTAGAADAVQREIGHGEMRRIVTVTADDMRRFVKGHLFKQAHGLIHLEHRKAVVVRHRVAKGDAFDFKNLRQRDFLAGETGSIEPESIEVCARIAGMSIHG